jgi:hypothetical protein
MPAPTHSWRLAAPVFAAALVTLAALPSARGDLFVLKDGTVLQGKVRREGRVEYDKDSKEAYVVHSGVYYVDDGPRRVFFPKDRVGEVVPEDASQEESFAHPEAVYRRGRVPPIIEVMDATAWDANWDRDIRVRTYDGNYKIGQRLGLLTPHFALVYGRRIAWDSYYLTSELGPDVVKDLLEHRPKRPPVKGKKAPAEPKPEDELALRFRVCDFFAQAGWFDQADKGLDAIVKDHPDERGRVEGAREVLARVRARERLEQIKRRVAAAQYGAARRMVADFPDKGAAEPVLTKARDLQAEIEAKAARLAEARRQLDALGRDLKAAEAPAELRDAAAALAAELHPDRVPALETFLGQAAQAERQRKAGQKPSAGPEQLAALAVTGWLLGSAAAEPRPQGALRLWRARQLVLAYLRAEDGEERQKLLDDYRSAKNDPAGVDEFCRLIPLLPPTRPEGDLGPGPAELRAGKRRHAPVYSLQLPPEYTHNRPSPVLIVLGPSGEKAGRTLLRWAEHAAENGFLLAAVEWEQEGAEGRYTFSEREHAAVLETLRDLRRRFAVDSDRVFLAGAGQGSAAAFDIGLAHPDEFAGLVTVSGGPSFFSSAYWRNAQYLPVYMITGDRSGDSNTQARKQFEVWGARSYPAIWVQYKGRGVEWFPGELPSIFDWLRNQRRAWPLHQLGTDGIGTQFGNEFTILRPGDNRFYWLTADEVSDRCCTTLEGWKSATPASLTGRIDPTTNEVAITARGIKQLTLWLGRNGKGESMIDFDKPLTVRVNAGARLSSRKVSPSLQTLLDDLADRGDRQRLFLAKIPLKP